MRLIATRPFRYGGRQLQAGDEFDAKLSDATAWKAIRYAKDAPEPPAKKPAPKAEPDKPGGYKTRRLKADDD